MARPAAQPAEVLRAWQKDEFYKSRLSEALARLLGGAKAGAAPPAAAVLYSACTTLLDLQTLGEEYSGIVQVDDSYHRLPSFAARLLSTILSVFGDNVSRKFLRYCEKQVDHNSDLRPEAKTIFVVILRSLAEILPQFESVYRALCYINRGPIQIGKTLSGIDYVQVRPAAAAYYAHLRLLGLVTLAHVFISCGRTMHRVKLDIDQANVYCNEPETSNTCVACLEELGQPCALPCGHVFCMQCSYGALESCALCRTTFTRNTVVPLQNYAPSR